MLLVFMIVLYFGASRTTPLWMIEFVEIALGAVLIWALSFFRDPEREVPQDKNILLAPADGTIADIETVDEPDFIGGKAIRVGIFLSIFDVHINRSPCRAKVEKITYREGQFLDARNPEAGKVNESNDLWLIRNPQDEINPQHKVGGLPINNPQDEPGGFQGADKLIVRQISGAIARRIVCRAQIGQNMAAGEKFGMIKFGSRTELYVPARDRVECLVKIGDKVKAGLTPIIKL